jgi:sugar phosphate isomerase/epimerase
MKVSCLPVSFYGDILEGRMSVRDWARQAATTELDAVDLSVLFMKSYEPAYVEGMRRDVEEAGLGIAMLVAYPDLTHPAQETRAAEVRKLERAIAAAAALGAELVRVLAGQAHPQTSRKEGVKWAVEGLMHCQEVAEQHGVRLAYENHSKPAKTWELYDFSYPEDVFLEVLKATEATRLGVNFDTATPFYLGDDAILLLERILDRVISIHVHDCAMFPEGRKTVVVGRGEVPLGKMFSMLKSAGFDDWLCIEEASFTGYPGIRDSVANTRKLWQLA